MKSKNWSVSTTQCSAEECTKTIKNHAWARIKSDWFQQKDGKVWCPEHTPEWVDEWRSKKESH